MTFKRIRKYYIYAFFLFVLIIGIKIYSLYFNKLDFGDEYDNMVAPWLMSQGYVLYRDFFSHHFPLLFFMGVPLELVAHTKLLYRAVMLGLTFASFSLMFIYLKGIYKYSVLPLILLASFGISLYGGQQFADGPIWALMLLGAYFLILDSNGLPMGKKRTVMFSTISFLMFLTSPMHIVAFVILIIFHLLWQIKNKHSNIRANLIDLKFYVLTIFCLTAIFLIYLLITKSLRSFVDDAFNFNSTVYFFRESKLITGFKPLDVYLNAIHEVYIHFYLLIKTEGLALLTFIRASKFLVAPFAIHGEYTLYVKTIFTDLYNNFFSIEMIVALFYLMGVITFLLQRRISHAILIIVFLLPLRLRIATNTHLSPYYLFSFWLVSLAITFCLIELIFKKRFILNSVIIFVGFGLISLFIAKDWYSFNQTSFNSFPKENELTVNVLRKSPSDSKIFVFRDFSASYYYESTRLPYGYFVNFFPWYSKAEILNNILVTDLKSYKGDYLIISTKEWNNYKSQSSPSWRDEYFKVIDGNFEITRTSDNNYFFKKR